MRNKYRAKATVVDGIRFHSKRESERYQELKLLERAGKISNLRLQHKFPIDVNAARICTYIADFVYFDEVHRLNIVEDVKGAKTALYSLKKKLVQAIYGIEITEVP